MAVSQTNSASAKAAPQAEPKQAPKNEPKKPQDKTAATQAPGETRAATKNAFGDVPMKDGPKQADDAKTPDNHTTQSTSDTKSPPASDGKAASTAPKKAAPVAPKLAVTDPKSAPDPDKVTSPVDPKVQSILDAKLPDGKSVKEKLDTDAPAYILKAAQDHYNKQKENKEPLDAISKFFLNHAAKDIATNGIKDEKVYPEKLVGVFNTAQIDKNLEEIAKDAGFIQWANEQQANAVEHTIKSTPDIAKLVAPHLLEGENYVNALRRMQSDYVGSQDFADGVANAKTPEEGKNLVADAMKALSSLGLGEKEMLGVGNTLAENIRGKYTPEAPKPVIDPNTNKPIQTDDGDSLAILPDGTHIALDKDGKQVADKYGHAYVYHQDGSARLDAGNAWVQYDAKAAAAFSSYGGTRYMVGKDGKAMVDAQGRSLALDKQGSVPVALGKNGKVVTDTAGNKLVFDPVTGKALADPNSGKAAVIDPATKGIVQADHAGKIAAAGNGDPYAVDQKTGKFVTDPNGNYVLISKANAVPGIVPGYVIDKNGTMMVVNPYNQGKPIVDPASGKTVILAPKSNTPQLVPLDANGVPQRASDGKNIVYNETGHTVVPNEGKGPDWLVNADGNYTQNAAGNYIGVHANSGITAPVDENGFLKNVDGLVHMWDIKANATMKTPSGDQVLADKDGNLFMANAGGYTVVEEKSGLPYLLDPKTLTTVVNPDTGRSILLDKNSAPVEYNADDGRKYFINPETRTTVKTADGNAVVTNDDGIPYAIRPDGTPVTNPETGNIIVYGVDGQPATEKSTGYKLEITSGGKAHVIDPQTGTPMAERAPRTGGYQVYNPDGTEVTNPDTGNKIQLVPDSGLKVEIDPATGRPVTDVKGNPLVIGKDNRPMKTPEGNAVVADLKTGLPVSAGADGKLIADPASGLPKVVHAGTGAALADPQSKAPVVADPKSRLPVQVDAGGKIITDPVTAMPVAVDMDTGAQIKGPDGALAFNDPRTGLPVYYDKQSKLFTVVDPKTGQALSSPTTGAKTVIDVGSGLVFNVLPDAQGNHIIVDENGQPVKSDNGNQPYFDKNTGKVVVVNDKGEVVDPKTGKAPEAFEPKDIVYTTPILLMGLPGVAMMAVGKPLANKFNDGNPTDFPDDDEILPAPLDPTSDDTGVPGPSDAKTDIPIEPSADVPDRPWDKPGYKMTPEERAEFIKAWNDDYGDMPFASYDKFLEEAKSVKAAKNALQGIPDAELAAVRGYTGAPWFSIVNKALYTGDPALLKKYTPYIKAMKSGLMHMQEAGYTFKGPSVRHMNLSPKQFSTMFSGNIYVNPQFMSTTTLANGAPLINEKNTKIQVNHLDGVLIEDLSIAPSQKEVIGIKGKEYAISNMKPAGSRGGIGTWFKPRPINKVTLTELPPGYTKWAKLGKALGYAAEGFEVLGGAAQAVFGGFQIDDGIKSNNPYDIAAGALNVASGALAIGSPIAGLIGSSSAAALAGSATAAAAAAAAAPLAVAGIILGGIAGIVDFVGTLDDDEQFADKLEQDFGPLGILLEGWRPKAQEAYKYGYEQYMGPDYQG